jgi:tRNA (Thr-GGU) A37 N-methylase
MTDSPHVLRPIGHVESPLVDRDQAPKQGDEGSPEAWLVFDPEVARGLADLHTGTDVILLTWLDRASRDASQCTPEAT